VLLGTGVVLRLLGLDFADKAASVASLLVAVVSLLWPPAQARPAAVPGTFLADPRDVLDTLGDRNLRTAWDEEWRRRRLHDPGPLPLRWSNDDELADHWQNIRGTDGPAGRLRLDGCWDDLADVFERVPSRRLVIVGDGGRGKSVLCLHLARRLQDRRPPGGPVPVVLALSGWDPTRDGLDEWLAARLPVDVAAGLAEDAGDGRSVARAMADGGHLVPILDGLDELPVRLHRAAVAGINAAGSGPLVVTSRRAEFAAATAQDRVTAAAVVRVEPLPPDVVAAWLTRTSPPIADGTTKWTPVLGDGGTVGAVRRRPGRRRPRRGPRHAPHLHRVGPLRRRPVLPRPARQGALAADGRPRRRPRPRGAPPGGRGLRLPARAPAGAPRRPAGNGQHDGGRRPVRHPAARR
jgi:hypothetical protein